jgi:hypothetical protein
MSGVRLSPLLFLAKKVNEETHLPDLTEEDLREGVRSVLELVTDQGSYSDPPFDGAARRLAWRAGYLTAMTDVVEALADEWGIQLTTETRRRTSHDTEGEHQ